MRLTIFSLLMVLLFTSNGYSNEPDAETIYKWYTKDEFNISKVSQIRLSGGEIAYLAEGTFPLRGRNFYSGALLVRPSVGQAQEIDIVNSTYVVHDFKEAPFTYIEVISGASGQGNENYKKELICFNGWDRINIMTVEYENSDGCYNYPHLGFPCIRENVDWNINVKDNIVLLEEIIVKSKWSNPKLKKINKNVVVNKYFVNGKKAALISKKKSNDLIEVPH